MIIGGLQKFTALDYPGKIAATVFTVGCNFRCPFCHNGEIVEAGSPDTIIDEIEVLEFLKSRVGELDGVCISGGEPTLQPDLLDFMEEIKRAGFLVKLDTNGSNTETVRRAVERGLLDYLAIDIKTSLSKYHLVKVHGKITESVLETISYLANAQIPFELRTTVVPGIVSMEDFDDIARGINGKNKKILGSIARYCIQAFRPQKCLDSEFEKIVPYEDLILEEMAEKMRKYCERVEVLK